MNDRLLNMSTLLLSILGLTVGTSLHCAVRREISPCTCRRDDMKVTHITCERMTSFGQVVDALQDRFGHTDKIALRMAHSNLEDLGARNFRELNMSAIQQLKINYNNLRELSENTFVNLPNVYYLSFADNSLPEVPQNVLKNIPNVKTLDLGRNRIQKLADTNFKSIPYLLNLVLPGNVISEMESNSIPSTVTRLHLGRNQIKDLNGTLRNLSDLEWLFINANELTNLEDQLPINGHKLMLIHAANNKLERLPNQLKTFDRLESLFIQHNLLTGFDGTLSKAKRLTRLQAEHNLIETLSDDEFSDTEHLMSLQLAHNRISTLNNCLKPLRRLQALNLSNNLLTVFSLQDIKGLLELRYLDLSYNKITSLIGPMANQVEWETRVTELNLEHNQLHSLNGALSGLPGLLRLKLGFNRITRISPDDFIGLEQLIMLDVSYNQLTTLEELSKTFLPSLEELTASHNFLTVLEHDFHGLPVLCWADLSNNQIVALGRDLVSKTRCKVHGVLGNLMIYLQENPILCDTAFPEIMSIMEVNHTRIHGVAHCQNLGNPEPTPQYLSPFLGTPPESTPSPPLTAYYAEPLVVVEPLTSNRIQDVDNTNNMNSLQHVVSSEPSEKPPIQLDKLTS